MNRAVVVLLLLIANVIVSSRNPQLPGISSASPQDRSRARSRVIEKNVPPQHGRPADPRRESFASSQAPGSKSPDCRNVDEARAALWLRL